MNQPAAPAETSASTAKIIYILYLVSLVAGITSIVGVIMAYMNRGDAPDWLKTHYTFLIRTFWIGFLYAIIGALLSIVVIGFLVLLFVLIWFIVRCVKGMQTLERNEPMPDPESWMFG